MSPFSYQAQPELHNYRFAISRIAVSVGIVRLMSQANEQRTELSGYDSLCSINPTYGLASKYSSLKLVLPNARYQS
ncbi:hypothetical protein OAF24_02625 [bacterium]|nr:hypothetical protein [bacterium]